MVLLCLVVLLTSVQSGTGGENKENNQGGYAVLIHVQCTCMYTMYVHYHQIPNKFQNVFLSISNSIEYFYYIGMSVLMANTCTSS